MRTRASKRQSPEEEGIAAALRTVEATIGAPLVPPKNKHAQALSKLGASKGGLARAAALSTKRRREIAKKAAAKRWAKKAEAETPRG